MLDLSDGRTDGRTADGRTDTVDYRDAETYLKRRGRLQNKARSSKMMNQRNIHTGSVPLYSNYVQSLCVACSHRNVPRGMMPLRVSSGAPPPKYEANEVHAVE